VFRNRLLAEWLIGTALLVALAVFSGQDGPDRGTLGRRPVEALIYDGLQRLTGAAPGDDVVIVEIDDMSLDQIGQWPWPRTIHAALVERLASLGVRAIGLDVLLAEPGVGDEALAAELIRYRTDGNVLVLPVTASLDAGGRPTPLYPLPAFGLHTMFGHVHFRIDEDGVVRGLYLEEAGYPSFSLRLAALAGGIPALSPAAAAIADATPARRDRSLAEGSWEQRHVVLLPRLSRPPPRVSYGAVLRGEVAAARLAGRVVLVGASAAGLGDRYSNGIVARGALSPGVELHAAALSAIRGDKLIGLVPTWVQDCLAGVLVAVMMATLYRLRPQAGLLATLGMGIVTLAIAAVGLHAGYWWSPFGALLGIALAYPLWSWRRLEVATAGLVRQARSLVADEDLLPPRHPARLPAEPIARSVQQLNEAAARSLTLRRFVQGILQRMPHPAFVTDAQDRLVIANDRLRAAFDRAPDPGTTMTPWLREHAGLDIARAIDGPQHHAEMRDTRERDWLVDTARFEDPEWRAATLVQLVDISEIRAAQREREQTLRFLSHDLRSPAISILSIADRLRRQGDAPPWLDDVQQQAQRSLELANGFVQLARAEAQIIVPEPLDLANLVTEAVDSCWQLAHGRSVQVLIEGVREGAHVRGDAQLLRRALVNLVDNAIKYSPDGAQVRVTTRRHAPAGEPAWWSVTVTDQGEGLADDELDRVFDAYWRSERSLDRPGAGLGLTFVKVIADRHAGSITVRHAEPHGACFELRLPALPDAH
jgi:signal transduction histidine kinase/CHASE2 domain-containing sensor protein